MYEFRYIINILLKSIYDKLRAVIEQTIQL